MSSSERINRDILYLTENIGIRLTGSEQERAASQYLTKRFLEYVPYCAKEDFAVKRGVVQEEIFRVQFEDGWKEIPARTYDLSPSTNGESLEADLVFFDSHTDYQRKDLSYLRDKAVLHYGGTVGNEEDYCRLLSARPAYLIMVNTRFTSSYPISDSILPTLARKYGTVPTIGISFQDAWELLNQRAFRASLRIDSRVDEKTSCNIIAEIPGTDADSFCIYACAHMDSVAGSVGADDNAAGCAILVELARLLSKQSHKHTIRLLAFGAEEQLSAGSSEYVRRHQIELRDRGRFICNFDSCATAVGWNRFTINACPELRGKIRKQYQDRDVFYVENLKTDPCNDAFPFMAAGLPGLTLMRCNCELGRFYHHQPNNAPDVISPDKAAQLAEATAALISWLANQDDLNVFCRTDEALNDEISGLWNELFGGWN